MEDVLAHRTHIGFEDNLRASTALQEVAPSRPPLEDVDTDWLRETANAYRHSPASPFLGTQLRHTTRPHTSYGMRSKSKGWFYFHFFYDFLLFRGLPFSTYTPRESGGGQVPIDFHCVLHANKGGRGSRKHVKKLRTY